MELNRAIEIFKETGVMLEGHFLLTSGRHSNRYMQCARLFEYPQYSELMCRDLAEKFKDERVEIVIGPALGGVIMSYEVGRQLGVRNFFAERGDDGAMTLRRGFVIPHGARVLLVEDAVTTGGSVKEVMALVKDAGGIVVGVGAIVDRSAGKVDFGCRFEAVASMRVESWEAVDCPLCKEGTPAIKPGSRKTVK